MDRLYYTFRSNFSCLLLLLPCLLLGAAGQAQAEQEDFGDYTVHYVAVNSTFLQPAIAERYGIVRSARRAFLNIAVQRKLPGGGTEAVSAVIRGSRNNLMQQSETIEFKEVREGEAVYYIGEFGFSNAEPVRFELDIHPEGQARALRLSWDTRLYVN